MTTLRDDERAVRESYDRVPYPSASNHFTHPDRLATLALLLDRVITVSCGAAATNFTVPVTLLPPLIVLGLKLTDFTPTTTLVSVPSVLFDT